ncbi:Gfo/Idh/MocA family protein [Haliangium sp.]|uniref:Gfo/Idh/MocA family protein n=1 Tax=Haliangium sp. TaxID=2663208 RepID=UPI003D103F67
MQPIRVGLIGCGYWGPKLARNFSVLEEFTLAGAADIDERRLDSVRKHYPVDRVTTDVDALLDADDIDAVAIATPVSTHAELALRALAAGKHVLIEKPMAHDVDACERMIAAAEDAKRVLLVDHTFLYTGAVRKIREIIDSGSLGDVYYFDSVRVNLGLFQHDCNVIWDLAPHDLSIMLHLIDDRPVRVSALGASPIDMGKNIESIAYITVVFAGGIIGHVHVNWLAPVKVRKTLIGGSRQMIIYDDIEPDTKVQVYDRGVDVTADRIHDILVQYRTGDMYGPRLDRTEALRRECVHFADCIRGTATPLTSGRDGLAVVRVLEAAVHSMQAGGAPVDLDS